MTVTPDTLQEQARLRVALDDSVDDATRKLAEAWGRAWDELATEWEAATSDMAGMAAAGAWPTAAPIRRATRVQTALAATREALNDLAKTAGVTVTTGATALADEAGAWVETITRTQLPPSLWVGFNRTDPAAIKAIVERTTRRVTAKTRPLPADTEAVIRSVLTRGVAVGDHPETAARAILNRTREGFDGGLSRARTITRTEMLDAHREAARAHRAANTDVIGSWQWHAELSSRTCPGCLGMHGTIWPAGEPGPNGHPCCRCTSFPVAKTWADLGFALPEPEQEPTKSGEEWLTRQPRAVQEQILGKRGYAKWAAGEWPSSEWAAHRENPGWRPSWNAAPPPA